MKNNSEPELTKNRLEAFSDGVIAIIITIMVLELKVPHTTHAEGFIRLWPTFMSYALSYITVAIYWVKHHHLFHCVEKVGHRVLWANNLLLFFLSLIPFATAYVGENHLSAFPTALYLALLLACGLSYYVLSDAISRQYKNDTEWKDIDKASKRKNNLALALYTVGIGAAYIHPMISFALAAFVAAIYFIPTTWLD
jgi:uncharacterized membrane protein